MRPRGSEQLVLYPTPEVRIVRKVVSGAVASEVTVLHHDGLGSVRAVTAGTGMRTETSSYRPYGEQSEGTYALNVPEAKGYIGERFDADAGLQYLNARYYDPRLGMFLQTDWWEVTEAGVGTNRYAYAFEDPINSKDVTGHWANPSSEACGNCKKTPKGGYFSEVNPERKRVQPGNKYCGAGCAGRVTYEKRPGDAAEYGPHAQSRMGLVAAGIDDVGQDPNADMKAVAELLGLASGVSEIYNIGRFGISVAKNLVTGQVALTDVTAQVGQKVYRVFGDNPLDPAMQGAMPLGRSWTRVDPRTVSNYRNEAGLPTQNTGRFLAEGRITNIDGVSTRSALELGDNVGRLDEVVLRDPASQVEVTRVLGLNPPF